MGEFVRANAQAALEVPRWAWRFYLRHWPIIVGISAVPAVERLVSRLWGDDRPVVLLEAITGVARLVLAIAVLVLIYRESRAARSAEGPAAGQPMTFIRTRWLSVIFQLLMIAALSVVFDLIPDQVIGPLVPDSYRTLYFGVLLAVKNPTVIAFTAVWTICAVWQAVTWNPGSEGRAPQSAPDEVPEKPDQAPRPRDGVPVGNVADPTSTAATANRGSANATD